MSESLEEALATETASIAFRDVYATHATYVWRLARRLGVRPDDLPDLCQEVFVVVHRKLASFEGRASLRTWLYGITVRCVQEHQRKHRRRREEVRSDPPTTAVMPTQLASVEQRDMRRLLDVALDTLQPGKRAVFVLYELEELSMTDIAAIVDCPLQTAYSRLHSARDELRKTVSKMQWCDEEGLRPEGRAS